MELFVAFPEYSLCRCEAEQLGVRSSVAISGGIREACPICVNPRAGDEQLPLDPSFAVSPESDPFDIVAREEALELCRMILGQLTPEKRAVLRACFFGDDEELIRLGLDPNQVKLRVKGILLNLRALLSPIYAPGDVF